jgi:hypothetical protein
MSEKKRPCGPFVEFVFRVYESGDRERYARLLVRDARGNVAPGPVRPQGELGEFVAEAVREATGRPRRVTIDGRAPRRPSRR